MRTVVTVWMTWHTIVTIDIAMGGGIRVVVLGHVALVLGLRSSSLGHCSLSRTVMWQWASGMAMGRHW